MNIFLSEYQRLLDAQSIKKLQKDGYIIWRHDLTRENITQLINEHQLVLFCVEYAMQALDALRVARTVTHIPIIIIAEHIHESDVSLLLDHGADDCIHLPVQEEELSARVFSLMRRSKKPRFKKSRITIGQVYIDLIRNTVCNHDHTLSLTKTEYKFLRHFALYKGHVVTRKDLSSYIRDKNATKLYHAVDVHVFNLRKKIERMVEIKTLPNRGFIIYK